MDFDLCAFLNFGIALAYVLIPLTLLNLLVQLWRTSPAVMRGMIALFVAFIGSCATGHLLEALHAPMNQILTVHLVTWLSSTFAAVRMPAIGRQIVRFVHYQQRMHDLVVESEARMQAFLNCPRIVAWIKDEELAHVYNNRTLIELFGDRVGYRDRDWLSATVASSVEANDLEVLASGNPCEYEESVPIADGSLRRWRSYKFPMRVGRSLYVGGLAIDITEEENLKQQLQQTYLELEQFAYAASHDLRTPLRGIDGLLTILKRRLAEKLDNKDTEILEQILKDCGYATELVNGILEYSRVGRIQGELQEVPIGELLQDVVERMAEELEECQAVVQWGWMPIARCDRTQIARIFENLLSNAVKYRSDAPLLIRIEARERPTEWEFSIVDNGIGIAPEYLDQLFVMFRRLHSRAEIEGTGIGLATVRKIAKRHGGSAWAESQGIGHGSTFKFSISRAKKN